MRATPSLESHICELRNGFGSSEGSEDEVSCMNWETRPEPGWEEQLYPDAEEPEDGVEEPTTE